MHDFDLRDPPGTRRPRADEVADSEAGLDGHVAAEDGDVVAALRGAAATIHGELTEDAYRTFRDRDNADRPTVEQITERFGSFGAALASAGIQRDDRS